MRTHPISALLVTATLLALTPACRRATRPCNTLVNQAPRVTFTARPGPPPAFAGGAIHDGVYEAVLAEGYGAMAPRGRRMTLAVSDGGTRFSWAGELLDPTGTTATASIRADAAVTVTGRELALTTLCASVSPSPLPDRMAFTATPDRLVLGFLEATGASVTTYEKRRSAEQR
jgi:hypothetical protein